MKEQVISFQGQKDPPTGWSCFLPELPQEGKRVFTRQSNFGLLKSHIEKQLEKHGFDSSNAAERIHRHTAQRLLREGHTEWVSGERRKRTFTERWKGAKAAALVAAREALGKPILTIQKDAEERALVCASGGTNGGPCPMNLLTTGESILEVAEEAAMSAMVDDRTTEMDSLIGKCGACSCNLSTIVHLNPEVVTFEMSAADWDKHPKICWKHKLRK